MKRPFNLTQRAQRSSSTRSSLFILFEKRRNVVPNGVEVRYERLMGRVRNNRQLRAWGHFIRVNDSIERSVLVKFTGYEKNRTLEAAKKFFANPFVIEELKIAIKKVLLFFRLGTQSKLFPNETRIDTRKIFQRGLGNLSQPWDIFPRPNRDDFLNALGIG